MNLHQGVCQALALARSAHHHNCGTSVTVTRTPPKTCFLPEPLWQAGDSTVLNDCVCVCVSGICVWGFVRLFANCRSVLQQDFPQIAPQISELPEVRTSRAHKRRNSKKTPRDAGVPRCCRRQRRTCCAFEQLCDKCVCTDRVVGACW